MLRFQKISTNTHSDFPWLQVSDSPTRLDHPPRRIFSLTALFQRQPSLHASIGKLSETPDTTTTFRQRSERQIDHPVPPPLAHLSSNYLPPPDLRCQLIDERRSWADFESFEEEISRIWWRRRRWNELWEGLGLRRAVVVRWKNVKHAHDGTECCYCWCRRSWMLQGKDRYIYEYCIWYNRQTVWYLIEGPWGVGSWRYSIREVCRTTHVIIFLSVCTNLLVRCTYPDNPYAQANPFNPPEMPSREYDLYTTTSHRRQCHFLSRLEVGIQYARTSSYQNPSPPRACPHHLTSAPISRWFPHTASNILDFQPQVPIANRTSCPFEKVSISALTSIYQYSAFVKL